jgi:Holliday junction DNA helicase RuvA
MIAQLRGRILERSATDVVVDVGGVGYAVTVSLSTLEKLPPIGGDTTLLTHMIVREDAMLLFGFGTRQERDLFRLLISVSGIGPKLAISILSGIGPVPLAGFIASNDAAALTRVPGIGRKTAERLIVELRDTIGRIGASPGGGVADLGPASVRAEAMLALTALGYTRAAAERAIRAAIDDDAAAALSVEELVRRSLRHAV